MALGRKLDLELGDDCAVDHVVVHSRLAIRAALRRFHPLGRTRVHTIGREHGIPARFLRQSAMDHGVRFPHAL